MIYAPVINQWVISPQNVVTARLTHTSCRICEMQKGLGAEPAPCHVHTRPATRTLRVGLGHGSGAGSIQLGRWLSRLPPFPLPPVPVRLPCGLPMQFHAGWPCLISSVPFSACLHVWGVRFFHSLKVIRSGQFSPESLKASRESGKSH